MSLAFGAEKPLLYLDLEIRWGELEKKAAALEAQQKEVEAETERLRQERQELRRTRDGGEGPDGDGDPKLRTKLEELQRQCKQLTEEKCAETGRAEKLVQALKEKGLALAELDKERLQSQYERNLAQAKLQPAQALLAQSELERGAAEAALRELRQRLLEAEGERQQLQLQNSGAKRDAALQAEALQAGAALHRQVAEEARSEEKAARREVQAAQEQLREKSRAFAAERARLEGQLRAKREELARERESREAAEKKLAAAQQDKKDEAKSHMDLKKETGDLRSQVTALERSVAQLERDREELLQGRLPGFHASEGMTTASDLLKALSAAQDEAKAEQKAKEEVQAVLRDVQREVRLRFKALANHGDEAVRLHRLADETLQENAGLRERLERLKHAKLAAEKQVQRVEHSNHVLEAHMSSLSQQLAVLLHENRKLGGKSKVQAAGAEAASLEADRRCFRNAEELARQNVALRLALAKLMSEAKESEMPHVDLVGEAEGQMELKDSAAAPAAAKVGPETAASEAEAPKKPELDEGLAADLASLRRDFMDGLEGRKAEADELRGVVLELRKQLSKTQRELEDELESKASLAEKLKASEAKLRDSAGQGVGGKALAVAAAQSKVAPEAPPSQDVEDSAALEQVARDREHSEAQALLARQRVEALEQSNAQLAAERAAQQQLCEDLDAELENRRKEARRLEQQLADAAREQAARAQEAEAAKERERRLGESHCKLSGDVEALRAELRSSRVERLRAQAEGAADEAAKGLWQRLAEMELYCSGLADEVSRYQKHLLELSERRAKEEGSDAPLFQQLARELRREGASSETRRRELACRLEWREQELSDLRGEASALQGRLEAERKQVQALQEQFRDAVSRSELEQALEAGKQHEAKVTEITKDLEEVRAKIAPLQAQLEEQRQKSEEAAKEKAKLEAEAMSLQEAVKNTSQDTGELKRLREDSAKWQLQRGDLNGRVEKLQEELQASKALKEQNEDLTRQATETKTRIEQLTKAKAQLQDSVTKKDAHCKQLEFQNKQLESVKNIGVKRAEELEQDQKKSKEENAQLLEEAKHLQEDAKQSKAQAERAIKLAADFQTALESAMAQKSQESAAKRQRTEEPAAEAPKKAAKTVTSAEHSTASASASTSKAPEEAEAAKPPEPQQPPAETPGSAAPGATPAPFPE